MATSWNSDESSYVGSNSLRSSPASSFVSDGYASDTTPVDSCPSTPPSPKGSEYPLKPETTFTIAVSVPPQQKQSASWVAKLALWLWVLSFASFGWWCGSNQFYPQRLPLTQIAHVTAQHVGHGLDVVRDLNALRASCHWRDLHPTEMTTLSLLTRDFSSRAADNLLVSSQTVTKLSRSLSSTNSFVAGQFAALSSHIGGVSKLLKNVANPRHGGRNIHGERTLKAHIDDYLAETLPADLRDLRLMLDVAADRVEIITYQRDQLLPNIKFIRRDLGLNRPWLWWKRKAWDDDSGVQERVRLLGNTIDTFNAVERFRVALEKARDSLDKYIKADIFEHLDDYPLNQVFDKDVSLEQYLDYIKESLEHLQHFVQIARSKIHSS